MNARLVSALERFQSTNSAPILEIGTMCNVLKHCPARSAAGSKMQELLPAGIPATCNGSVEGVRSVCSWPKNVLTVLVV